MRSSEPATVPGGGHAGIATCAVHLTLGPATHAPRVITAEHEHCDLDPTINVRGCLYEHARMLLEMLQDLGHDVGIEISDDAFGELERIGS